MLQKKYQVFVSSTFKDLAEERQSAIRNILDLQHIPAGMELFPAADVDQLSYIKKIIDQCDYYLLIVGGRYGSVDADGISFTEHEYDYAVATKKIIIAFVHSNVGQIAVDKSETGAELVVALNNFRQKVMSGRLVKPWSTPQELEIAVLKSLMHAFSAMPQVGWVRGDNVASDETLAQANRALAENARLKQQLSESPLPGAAALEDLADLNDSFLVRYGYTYFTDEGSFASQASDAISWKDIFLSLTGEIDGRSMNEAIFEGIRVALENMGRRQGIDFIFPADRETIKVQMEALGLLKEITFGSSKRFELTPAGRITYIKEKAVKKQS